MNNFKVLFHVNESNKWGIITKRIKLLKLGVVFAACKYYLIGNEIDEKLQPGFVT